MKLNGIAGTGSGKLGSQVYASVAGQQVVRVYQNKVANPNTALQVNQRARLKLMSQLSAAFAPVIVIPKDGMKSSRNLFVKRNFDLSSGNDGLAQLSIENVQLTGGTAGLPAIYVSRAGGTALTVKLVSNPGASVSRVCYIIYTKDQNEQLRYIESKVVDIAGADGQYQTTFDYLAGDVVVYAYGMKDLNTRATANYGDYTVATGQDIASLFMGRDLNYNDYRFTQTRGVTLFAGNDVVNDINSNEVNVWVTISGPGSVIGAGTYTRGEQIEIVAVPNEGCNFICWKFNRTGFVLGYNQTIRLQATQNIDLIAVFEDPNSPTGGWNGQEQTNPLPGAYAEIKFDGTQVSIENGLISLDTTFDNLAINNIGDDHDVVYVPAGSTYGAADNVTLEPNAGESADYWMSLTNTGAGAIYVDNNLWFYILIDEWVNPYPTARLQIQNDEYATIQNSQAIIEQSSISVIAVANIPESSPVVIKASGHEDVSLEWNGSNWLKSGLGGWLTPIGVYVDGELWVTIVNEA